MDGVDLGRIVALAGVVAACAGSNGEPGDSAPADATPPAVDSLALSTADEIRAEIEMLGYEIGDLEAYLDANPPPEGVDPAAPLARARAAHAAASSLLAAGDTTTAVDSLEAVHSWVEEVKRSLALAEEWGEEIPDESPP